jgi:fatty acid desaturase
MTDNTTIFTRDEMHFTDEERVRFRRPRVGRLVFDLTLPWLQVIAGCWIFIAYPGFWTWLIAALLISGAQHGLSLIAHEASHFLVWPWDKRKNDWIGTYLFAAPTILPFNVYRQRHVIHHRLVSQSGDTKNVYLRDWSGWKFLLEVLRSLIGLEYILKVREALRIGKGAEYEKFDANLRRDQLAILMVNGVIFLVLTSMDPLHYGIPTYYFLLWLIPLITLSFLFAKIRALVEHQPPRTGCDFTTKTRFFMNTPGPMLRSVKARWLERLFLSKINFHFHAEHHLWPWISYQHLPEINSRIWKGHGTEKSMIFHENFIVMDRDYSSVLRDIFLGK